MTRGEISEKVKMVLRKKLESENKVINKITEKTVLEDFGFDSLDLMDIIVSLEKGFDSDLNLDDMITIDDSIEKISEIIEKKLEEINKKSVLI